MPHAPKTHLQKRREKQNKKEGRKKADKKYAEKRKNDPLLAMAQKIRSSARWQKIRKVALKRDKYLCVDPFKYHKDDNRVELAIEVNHIWRIRDKPELAFEPSNLASLCKDCHTRISRLENKGKPVTHLFLKKPDKEEPKGPWAT